MQSLQKIANEQGKKVVKQHFSSISELTDLNQSTVISMKRAVDKMVVQGRINDVFIVSCSRTPLGSFKGSSNFDLSINCPFVLSCLEYSSRCQSYQVSVISERPTI